MRHVTDVLHAVLGPMFVGCAIPADKFQYYLDRGKAVHVCTELIDADNLDWNSLDPVLRPYCEAYVDFRQVVGGKVLKSEHTVVNKHFGYAGRLDRVLRNTRLWPCGDTVFDYKTSGASARAALQTAAYAMAYKKTGWWLLRRAALALQRDGGWTVTDYVDKTDFDVWRACLTITSGKEAGDPEVANAWLKVKAWKSRQTLDI